MFWRCILAERSLFIEELALLTGNVLPASDERWRELERLGLAERVSSPHGTAWKAGDENRCIHTAPSFLC